MSCTTLNVDDALLVEAGEILGTSTKVATVNATLAEVVKLHKREEFLDALKSGEIDLTYDVRDHQAEPEHDGRAR